MTQPYFPELADPLRRWRRTAAHRVALVDRATDQRTTYAELDAETDRWTALLAAHDITRDTRVAAFAGNRRELIAAFFACGRLGAALVPINWRLATAELGPILRDCRPALLLGESRFRAAAEEATASAGIAAPRWIDLDDDAPALLDNAGDAPADTVIEPDTPHLVLYTSGSTGAPKGAVIPHRQIVWNAISTTTSWALGPDDIAPVSTPFFHTGGWNVFATPLWHRGGTVVLFDGFEPDAFIEGLAEERCTFALTVATQLVMIMTSRHWGTPLPSLRAIMVGGAPCPDAIATRVREAGYRLRLGYGLTECGPNCFTISDEEALRRPGSVGWPVHYLRTRIATSNAAEAEVGEIGELQLRGPHVFAGYLNDMARTREVFTGDGWLRTGDLARRDADGAHWIAGRLKQMYISGGENVFPGEVEAALVDCPGVAEVAVIGVPDEKWGEVGCAFVVRSRETTLTDHDVVAHARTRLAGYKIPRTIVFIDDMPRLASGKADRAQLARIPR